MRHEFCSFMPMLPLQLLRIFDYQQPKVDQDNRSSQNKPDTSVSGEDTVAPVQIERRTQADRRNMERREKQQATFLNTRKQQGRRRSPGRRASDQEREMQYKPISIKG